MDEIYLDNAATTRPWPEVVDEMNRVLAKGFGNASSLHGRGLAAGREVVAAGEAVASLVGSGQWKVLFNSGGCEADTTAVIGCVPKGKRDTVVTSTVEHAAVEEACKALVEKGARMVQISAGMDGVVDPLEVLAAVDDRTALVSINHVANEMGTVQPVEEIARLVKQKAPRCRVHVDAVQALAQLDSFSYPAQVDMLSVSAHKIHGPQGVGALLVRPNVRPRQLIFGGDQQEGMRPGTFNLPGIVGFSTAARLMKARRRHGIENMRALTDKLIEGAVRVEGVRQLGNPHSRAPGIAILAVDGVRAEVMLHALEARGVLASSGSACHSSRNAPPRCLREAGLKDSQGAVRFSLTLDTTAQMVEKALLAFESAVAATRSGRSGS